MWAAELPQWSPPPVAVPAEIEEARVELIAEAMRDEVDLVAGRLERGCRCLVACREGRVTAYGWISTGPEWIGEIGARIRPQPGDAYIWNCVTLAEHRRQGLFAALLVHLAQRCAEAGLTRLWIASVAGSGESAIAYAGFLPVLRISRRDLRGVRWLSVRAAANAPERLVASARSVLPLPRLSRRRLVRH